MLALAYARAARDRGRSSDLDAWVLLPLLSVPLAVPLVRTLADAPRRPVAQQPLADTGRLLAVFSVLLAAGLLLSS